MASIAVIAACDINENKLNYPLPLGPHLLGERPSPMQQEKSSSPWLWRNAGQGDKPLARQFREAVMRALALAALMMTAVPTAAWAEPADVRASVAATTSRTEANVKLDESRKPAEVLAFLGLEKGMRVLDMFGANQYWAEIVAPAVGPEGFLVVWQPNQFLNDKRRATFAEFAGRQKNVLLINSPFERPALGTNAYDFLLMNLDYHDVYWESAERKIPRMDPDSWVRILYAAMKPGGTVGIIDHVAAPGGDTRAVVEKLHRIDPAVVKADFERAGFVLETESDQLKNPADDRSLNVFDEKIRGKTDRFVFKFRKPR
jgi:predicted methyltransferase